MNSIKTIKIIMGIFAFSLISISCSKEDDNASQTPATIYPEENFLGEFKTKAIFNLVNQANTPSTFYYENGIVFKPTVKGKINAISLRLPTINTDGVRITIWNKQTQAIVATASILVQSANVEAKKTLSSSIVLEKDKEYVISYYSKIFYNNIKNTNILYPITCGNIVVSGHIYGGSEDAAAVAAFPNATLDKVFPDGISFDFQRTE